MHYNNNCCHIQATEPLYCRYTDILNVVYYPQCTIIPYIVGPIPGHSHAVSNSSHQKTGACIEMGRLYRYSIIIL